MGSNRSCDDNNPEKYAVLSTPNPCTGVRSIMRLQAMHLAWTRTAQRLKSHGRRSIEHRCSKESPVRPPKNRRPQQPWVKSSKDMVVLFIIKILAIIGLIFLIAKLPGFLLCWLMYAGQCG